MTTNMESDVNGSSDNESIISDSNTSVKDQILVNAAMTTNMESDLNDSSDNESIMSDSNTAIKKKRRRKPGIIYLSTIPSSMNVSLLQTYFGQHGQLGRTYFEPLKDKAIKKSRGHMGKRLQYSEGWVEFKSKRRAISVAEHLNNQAMGGKKKNPDNETLWNIKYLPRFKWAYLKQQLEYERQVRRQRLTVEVAQVRKDAEHYITASDIGDKLKRLSKKTKTSQLSHDKTGKSFVFKQKPTEEEFVKKKLEKKDKDKKFKDQIQKKKLKKQRQKKSAKPVNEDFLGSIFVGSENPS